VTIGNTTCEFEVTVLPPAAVAGMTSCGTTLTPSNPITAGSPIPDGTTIRLPYTGGNGGGFNDMYVGSAGVTGIVAGTPAGTINNGNGDLILTLSGTPASGPGGLATFTIRFAGNSCQVSIPVAAGGGMISSFSNCPGIPSGSLTQGTNYTNSSNVTITLDYTGGNGKQYEAIGQPSSEVAGLFASLDAGSFANGNGSLVFRITGTPATSGVAKFSISLGGQNCLLQIPVQAGIVPLPGNMKFLFSTWEQYFTTTLDDNYLPYSVPTATATTNSFSPDGTTERKIDIPFVMSTGGMNIGLPYEVTNTAVNLPAYSKTIKIPGPLTEDNIARDITLSWAAQTLQPGQGTLVAQIKATTDNIPFKKLDINTGLGNDYKGVLLGEFILATDAFGNMGRFQLRAIPVVVDRFIQFSNRQFVYGVVTSATGKAWLNHNLGANYNNMNSAVFNPIQRATSLTDFNAYGSLYQWGRTPNNVDLVNWTSATAGTPVITATTTTLATTDDAPADPFITPTAAPYDWRSGYNNTRWQTESHSTNPCPHGFRVPTYAEMQAELSANKIIDKNSNFSSVHRFTYAGYRSATDGKIVEAGTVGHYYTSTVSGTNAKTVLLNDTQVYTPDSYRANALSVRCIRNQ
jgi:uncharacterized protein (TIGR02145 family)